MNILKNNFALFKKNIDNFDVLTPKIIVQRDMRKKIIVELDKLSDDDWNDFIKINKVLESTCSFYQTYCEYYSSSIIYYILLNVKETGIDYKYIDGKIVQIFDTFEKYENVYKEILKKLNKPIPSEDELEVIGWKLDAIKYASSHIFGYCCYDNEGLSLINLEKMTS